LRQGLARTAPEASASRWWPHRHNAATVSQPRCPSVQQVQPWCGSTAYRVPDRRHAQVTNGIQALRGDAPAYRPFMVRW